jgi:hypothetical protein
VRACASPDSRSSANRLAVATRVTWRSEILGARVMVWVYVAKFLFSVETAGLAGDQFVAAERSSAFF